MELLSLWHTSHYLHRHALSAMPGCGGMRCPRHVHSSDRHRKALFSFRPHVASDIVLAHSHASLYPKNRLLRHMILPLSTTAQSRTSIDTDGTRDFFTASFDLSFSAAPRRLSQSAPMQPSDVFRRSVPDLYGVGRYAVSPRTTSSYKEIIFIPTASIE